MPRKGENIYKRKDGRWEGRVRQEDALPGKRKFVSVYGKTYREVKEKMERAKVGQLPGGKGFPDIEEAVGVWLDDREGYWKPTTYAAYRQAAEKYIVPYLGPVKINRIDNQAMENFAAALMDGQESVLSSNYQSYICAIVVRVLAHTKKKFGLRMTVPENPVTKCKKHPVALPGEHAMSMLENYLVADCGRDVSLGILVAFYTGIRIGELCALKWDDVDLADGVIRIKGNIQRVQIPDQEETKTSFVIQAPKTADSMRIVPIPPVLRPLLEQNRQEEERYLIRGTKYPWADPRTVQYQFQGILKKCGLESFNFHMLRHAFASRCIAMGFDVKSLSEILGHSDTRMTLNLYVHSTVQQKKQLMGRFDTPISQG